jgi:branched-chain amino acid transport system substrate-binding protein
VRRVMLVLATLTLLSSVAACRGGAGGTSTGDNQSPIKVGQIVSLTGNYTPLGTENQKSVALAVEQVNASGGVLGRKIELIVRDDKSQPDQSVLAFNDIKGSDVTAIIGSPFSNSALATIPLVDREKIPYLSLTPADEQVTPVHPNVFVIPATSATYGERILEYFKGTGVSKIAVAYDSKSSYAVAGFKGMQAKAGEYGVTLVGSPEFQTTTTEFSSVLAPVKSSGAQALVVWATGAPSVAIAKQYATAGLNIPLVVTGAQASNLWLQPVGPAAEGVVVACTIGVVGSSLPDGALKKSVEEFTGPFQTKYGNPPPQFAYDGYSAVKLLVAALAKAKSADRQKVQQALEGLTLTTPNGRYAYSSTNHAGLTRDYIAISTVKSGAFVPTEWTKAKYAAIAGK